MAKIAIIQEGPEYYDLSLSVDKAASLIHEAASQNADIIVFGECWFSGYPAWLDYCRDVAIWDSEEVKATFAALYDNALTKDGEELRSLCDLTRQLKKVIIVGANEKVVYGKGNSTIYNSIFIIDSDGSILNHHRKLMPTYTEKLVYGLGDGKGLRSVETKYGRLGALVCWEHWMPMARLAMHDEAEDIHFGLWPTVKEMNVVATRQYAHEGRCYAVAVGQIMKASQTPPLLQLPEKLINKPDQLVMRGGSCVVAPDGSFLLEPVYGKGGIIYVDLPSLENNVKERMNLAASGHYQRPDVFSYQVNRQRWTEE